VAIDGNVDLLAVPAFNSNGTHGDFDRQGAAFGQGQGAGLTVGRVGKGRRHQ
jgi:hypothetical protein